MLKKWLTSNNQVPSQLSLFWLKSFSLDLSYWSQIIKQINSLDQLDM